MFGTHLKSVKTLGSAVAASLLLSACSSLPSLPVIGGGGDKQETTTVRTVKAAPSMGVNSYLWRASLETLDFMPLAEVDPFGGVIITDWYASPEAPGERFKANVYILDTNLRADALKTSIFKQVRGANGWEDSTLDGDTSRKIENAILTRARELYISTVDG